MAPIYLSELKRLTPPYANSTDEEEAFRYWKDQTVQAKMEATARLTIDHYRELGVNVDKPMDKSVTCVITLQAKAKGD